MASVYGLIPRTYTKLPDSTLVPVGEGKQPKIDCLSLKSCCQLSLLQLRPLNNCLDFDFIAGRLHKAFWNNHTRVFVRLVVVVVVVVVVVAAAEAAVAVAAAVAAAAVVVVFVVNGVVFCFLCCCSCFGVCAVVICLILSGQSRVILCGWHIRSSEFKN